MANRNGGGGNAPIADLMTKVEYVDDRGEPREAWVTLCPLWGSRNGGYNGTLVAIPAPLLAGKPVAIIIKVREGSGEREGRRERGERDDDRERR